jgi:SAM-dependent methyltransferase
MVKDAQSAPSGRGERFLAPLRREVAGAAYGRVLEVGVGAGLNFPFYPAGRVTCVVAIEPDGRRLGKARPRAERAPVPVQLVQAAVEDLPFGDASFASAVGTLVFCSVADPRRGMREVYRVLQPGGVLLLVEHVRAHAAMVVALQTVLTPFTRLLDGNCHLTRDTEQMAREAGFVIAQKRELTWLMMPFVVLHAVKPG